MNPILSVKETAELLECSEYTVEENARKGDLPGLKFGHSWIFPAGALLTHLGTKALAEAERRRTPTPRTRPRKELIPPNKVDGAGLYEAAKKFGIELPGPKVNLAA